MKITFKKEPKETGLRSVGHVDPNTNIKVGGKIIGIIEAPYWATKDHKWEVRLAVEGSPVDNPNCSWHWVQVKERFDTEPLARKWVKENLELLKLDLHCWWED